MLLKDYSEEQIRNLIEIIKDCVRENRYNVSLEDNKLEIGDDVAKAKKVISEASDDLSGKSLEKYKYIEKRNNIVSDIVSNKKILNPEARAKLLSIADRTFKFSKDATDYDKLRYVVKKLSDANGVFSKEITDIAKGKDLKGLSDFVNMNKIDDAALKYVPVDTVNTKYKEISDLDNKATKTIDQEINELPDEIDLDGLKISKQDVINDKKLAEAMDFAIKGCAV